MAPIPHHGSDVRPCSGMCIRCLESDAPETLGLCPSCAVHTRIELAAGLRRLAEYLAAWAAFDEWCVVRDAGPAV